MLALYSGRECIGVETTEDNQVTGGNCIDSDTKKECTLEPDVQLLRFKH